MMKWREIFTSLEQRLLKIGVLVVITFGATCEHTVIYSEQEDG